MRIGNICAVRSRTKEAEIDLGVAHCQPCEIGKRRVGIKVLSREKCSINRRAGESVAWGATSP